MILFFGVKMKITFVNSRDTVDRGIDYTNFQNPLPHYLSEEESLLSNVRNLRCVTLFFFSKENIVHPGEHLSQIIVRLNKFSLLHSPH